MRATTSDPALRSRGEGPEPSNTGGTDCDKHGPVMDIWTRASLDQNTKTAYKTIHDRT